MKFIRMIQLTVSGSCAKLMLSEKSMSLSLDGVGKILDNLIIRAPIDGQLSASAIGRRARMLIQVSVWVRLILWEAIK